MSECAFDVCGQKVVPDLSGAAWFPDLSLLAVADLHFEKGTSFVRRGLRLPPYDTKATLLRLHEVVEKYRPACVIALGDSFHDGEGPARLDASDVVSLRGLTGTTNWIWIFGNHDPVSTRGISQLGGTATDELERDGLIFRHEPTGGRGEIAGHLHPGAAVHVRGRRIRRKCFATDGNVLVLPAFGAYTGSLNVCDRAFDGILAPGFRAHLIGRDRIYAISDSKLIPDRMAG